MSYLLRGILIGFVFGVPAGVIGALTMQRTFSYGRRAGLLTGLGSSFADSFYAALGVFVGTYIWWGAIAGIVPVIRERAVRFRERYMNKIFGTLL